MSFITPSLK
ncbi:hypothetical protein LINGRAHAP2_LOCUS36518 [Linum grandiflorum]